MLRIRPQSLRLIRGGARIISRGRRLNHQTADSKRKAGIKCAIRRFRSEWFPSGESQAAFHSFGHSTKKATDGRMEAAVERSRLKRADVLVASDRKTSSSPRAQSQVVPAGTSHPRFSWHANTQLPRERDKSSRAASSKTAEQNCRLHCRQNRRRPAPCRPPGPPLGQWEARLSRGASHPHCAQAIAVQTAWIAPSRCHCSFPESLYDTSHESSVRRPCSAGRATRQHGAEKLMSARFVFFLSQQIELAPSRRAKRPAHKAMPKSDRQARLPRLAGPTRRSRAKAS